MNHPQPETCLHMKKSQHLVVALVVRSHYLQVEPSNEHCCAFKECLNKSDFSDRLFTILPRWCFPDGFRLGRVKGV